MKTSRTGIDLIKRFEGVRLQAYRCSAGILTIGYGHTSAAGEPKVTEGMKITADEAIDILGRDLVRYEAAVQKALTRSPNQNQFDACVSLAFNIGPAAFAGSSVVKRFNAGDLTGAADAFLMWKKAGGQVLPGLEARRKAERELFLRPSAAPVAPTPIPVFLPATDAPRPSVWARLLAWWRS